MQHLGAQAAAAPKRSKPKRKKGSKKKAGASSKLVFIVKPDVAAQGRGIIVETQPERLLQTPSPTLVEAAQASSSTRGNPETATVIVQQYVPRPLTVGGHKFDLRLYCAVVSVHPTIRAFLLVRVPCCKKLATVRHSPAHAAPWRSSPQTEGLARFATVKYTPPTKKNKNSSARNMHLTNYSVNKAHNKGLPDLLPVTSVPIGDAASVPTLHGADGAGGLTVDDDRLFSHGAALSHTPRTGLGRAALETHAGAPPCPTPAPFPQVDPFAHLRRDPALREVRGVKWSLSALMAHLRQELGVDTPALWRDIRLVIAKTLLTIAPDLAHQYASASAAAGSSGGAGLPSGSARRSGVQAGSSAPHNTHKREGGFMCCELLGFDILLDTDTTWATPRFKPHPRPAPVAAAPGGGEPVTGPGDGAALGHLDMATPGSPAGGVRIRPLLLEVNQSPSFGTDARIDEVVKQMAIGDALRLAAPGPQWLHTWHNKLTKWRSKHASPPTAVAPAGGEAAIDPTTSLPSAAGAGSVPESSASPGDAASESSGTPRSTATTPRSKAVPGVPAGMNGAITRTEQLRWAYEDFVCSAGGYQRLLPGCDASSSAYYTSLVQLAQAAQDGSVQGRGKVGEARRADALAKRKALQEARAKRLGGGKSGAKPSKPPRHGQAAKPGGVAKPVRRSCSDGVTAPSPVLAPGEASDQRAVPGLARHASMPHALAMREAEGRGSGGASTPPSPLSARGRLQSPPRKSALPSEPERGSGPTPAAWATQHAVQRHRAPRLRVKLPTPESMVTRKSGGERAAGGLGTAHLGSRASVPNLAVPTSTGLPSLGGRDAHSSGRITPLRAGHEQDQAGERARFVSSAVAPVGVVAQPGVPSELGGLLWVAPLKQASGCLRTLGGV